MPYYKIVTQLRNTKILFQLCKISFTHIHIKQPTIHAQRHTINYIECVMLVFEWPSISNQLYRDIEELLQWCYRHTSNKKRRDEERKKKYIYIDGRNTSNFQADQLMVKR